MVRKINESNGNNDLAYANKIYDMACLVSDLGKAMENDKALKQMVIGILELSESDEYSQDIKDYAKSLNLKIVGNEFKIPAIYDNFKYDRCGFSYNKGKFYFIEDNLFDFWFTMEEAMENGRDSYIDGILASFNEDGFDVEPQILLDCIKEEYENLKTYKSRVRKLYDYMLDIGA